MNIEFHYYSIYILARHAGFDEKSSFILAYSSQHVDDNTFQCTVKTKNKEFTNYISQTNDILKPKKELMRIYPCFHFFPGDFEENSAMRKDGKLHLLNTTPNSRNVSTLLQKAIKTASLYRIGIALHTYADSFAHQNFVGYYDCFNAMKGLLKRMVPDIGHADAGFNPDIPGKIWKDERLVSSSRLINNTERFLQAASYIFDYLWNIENKTIKEKTKRNAREKALSILKKCYYKEFKGGDYYKRKRMRLYFEYGQMPPYDQALWIKEAVKEHVHPVPSAIPLKISCNNDDSFYQSDWYQFQKAVKDHQEDALNILEPVFKKMELDPNTF